MKNMNKLLFIALIGICSAPALSADTKHEKLVPVPEYSFCTTYQLGYSVGIVGTNWALDLYFLHDVAAGKSLAHKAFFHRGPDIYQYVRKSGGPPIRPIPKTDEYSLQSLVDYKIRIAKVALNQGSGNIVVSAPDFVVGAVKYSFPRKISLSCRVPNP